MSIGIFQASLSIYFFRFRFPYVYTFLVAGENHKRLIYCKIPLKIEFKSGRGHLPLSSFKAVFFDVGGTLIHVHPSVGDVYARHARPFGFSGSAQDLNERFRRQWKKMGGIESLGHQSGAEAERKFWHKLVYEVFQPLGGLDRFEEYFDLIFAAFREKSNWRIYEDVVESKILETLKKKRSGAGGDL